APAALHADTHVLLISRTLPFDPHLDHEVVSPDPLASYRKQAAQHVSNERSFHLPSPGMNDSLQSAAAWAPMSAKGWRGSASALCQGGHFQPLISGLSTPYSSA